MTAQVDEGDPKRRQKETSEPHKLALEVTRIKPDVNEPNFALDASKGKWIHNTGTHRAKPTRRNRNAAVSSQNKSAVQMERQRIAAF